MGLFGNKLRKPLLYVDALNLGGTIKPREMTAKVRGEVQEILNVWKVKPKSEYQKQKILAESAARNQWERLEKSLADLQVHLIKTPKIINQYSYIATQTVELQKIQLHQYIAAIIYPNSTHKTKEHLISATQSAVNTIPIDAEIQEFYLYIEDMKHLFDSIDSNIKKVLSLIRGAIKKEGIGSNTPGTQGEEIHFATIDNFIQDIPDHILSLKRIYNQLQNTIFLKDQPLPPSEESLINHINHIGGYIDIIRRNTI